MKEALLALTSLSLLSACVADPSQNRYNYNEVGQSAVVDFARIVSVKKIEIQGHNSGAGALGGAAVGAGAGSYVGNGSGKAWAVAGGAVAGAIAGGVIEQQLANKKGYRYIVVTEDKQTKTIVQYQDPDDVVFRKGDRVMVETKGSYQRVLPTDDLPDQIKRPRGIKIVE